MRIIHYFFIPILFLTSCVSSEIKNAASGAAQSIAGSVKGIGKKRVMSTANGSYTVLYMNIDNISPIADSINDVRLSSIAAFVFMQQLQEKDYSGIEKIQINLERHNTNSQSIFDIKQLIDSKKYIEIVQEFIAGMEQRSMERIKNCVDPELMENPEFLGFIIDSLNKDLLVLGRYKENHFKGFQFTEKKELNCDVFTTWNSIIHENRFFELKSSINTTTGKIIAVDFF